MNTYAESKMIEGLQKTILSSGLSSSELARRLGADSRQRSLQSSIHRTLKLGYILANPSQEDEGTSLPKMPTLDFAIRLIALSAVGFEKIPTEVLDCFAAETTSWMRARVKERLFADGRFTGRKRCRRLTRTQVKRFRELKNIRLLRAYQVINDLQLKQYDLAQFLEKKFPTDIYEGHPDFIANYAKNFMAFFTER